MFAVGLVVPLWPFGDGEAEAQEAPEAPACRVGYTFDPVSSVCVSDKPEFSTPELSCAAGTKVGHRGGGPVVSKRSCAQGELKYVAYWRRVALRGPHGARRDPLSGAVLHERLAAAV